MEMRSHLALPAFSLLLLVPLLGQAETPQRPEPSATVREAMPLVEAINKHVAARWVKLKVQDAPIADDEEFIRRIYLDIYGRIPRYTDVRDFINDKSPDKREKLIDTLLESNGYVANFTNFWRSLLIPQDNNQQRQLLQQQIHSWVQKKVRANTPYDKMIYELLTTSLGTDNPQDVPRRQPYNPGAGAAVFFQSNEFKPDNLASATSRLFLGVRLECANCHDHKFDKWKRKQFWQFASFFAGIQPAQPDAGVFSPVSEDRDRRELTIPGTDTKVQAQFLDGTVPDWKKTRTPREALADWVTSRDNPYFARAIVNRMWGHLMGVGIVDPVDDFTEDNQPSNPELLDSLAKAFVEHDYDLKYLIRAIVLSKPYQLTSRLTHASQLDATAFARMSLKGLTPEQFFDSLALATGYNESAPDTDPQRFGVLTPRAEFLAKFSNIADRRTEPQTSILQALSLMNGKFLADVTSVDRGRLLGAVIDYPYSSNKERIEVLYLSTLSRKPRSDELAKTQKYIESGGAGADSRKAVADILWVLLNSSEFLLNH